MADEVPPKDPAQETTPEPKELSEEDLEKVAGGYTFGGPVPLPGATPLERLQPVADLPGPMPDTFERLNRR